MVINKEIGLLRVLFEETVLPRSCPCQELMKVAQEEFSSDDGDAYNQKVSKTDELYWIWEPTLDTDEKVIEYPIENFKVGDGMYGTDEPLYDYEGEIVQDLVAQFLDNSDNEITKKNTDVLCDLWKLIGMLIRTTEGNKHQSDLGSWRTGLCDLAKKIWAREVVVGVEDGEGYYLFTYPGNLQSAQVNNIFKIDVLKVLGVELDQRNGDESCIANVRVNQKSKDEYVNGIRVSGYESWKGFKVLHECVDPMKTHFNTSLNLSELPGDKYQKVIDYKLSLASSPDLEGFGEYERSKNEKTNQVVPAIVNTDTEVDKNSSNEVGLGNVINTPVKTTPYKDITFL